MDYKSGGIYDFDCRTKVKEHSLKLTASLLAFCAFVAISFSFSFAQSAHGAQNQRPAQAEPPEQPQPLNVTEYSLPPGKMAKAEALYKTRTLLYLSNLVSGILILWILLKLRVAPLFRDLAERITGNRPVQTLIFVPLLLLSFLVLMEWVVLE